MSEDILCRGSMALGTGCGHCARCRAWKDDRAQSVDTSTPRLATCRGCHQYFTAEEAYDHRCRNNVLGEFPEFEDAHDLIREGRARKDRALQAKEKDLAAIALARQQALPDQGWQCPLCRTVYSPRVNSCTCKVDGTTTGNPQPVAPAPFVPPTFVGAPQDTFCGFCGGSGGYHNPACSWVTAINASAGSTA